MTSRTGQYIELFDLDGGGRYTDEAFVRGHVDEATFRAEVESWLGYMADEDGDDPREASYGPIRHVWARWCFDGGLDRWENPRRTLRTYGSPERGTFPVTAAWASSILRRAEATQRQEDADVADLLERYPGVEITHKNGFGRNYRFRVPGLKNEVDASWHDGRTGKMGELRLWARGEDVEAWDAFRATVSRASSK